VLVCLDHVDRLELSGFGEALAGFADDRGFGPAREGQIGPALSVDTKRPIATLPLKQPSSSKALMMGATHVEISFRDSCSHSSLIHGMPRC
jgi:hypothetical protein